MRRLEKLLSPIKTPKIAQTGDAGYDNARENIDPHLKSQVLDVKELGINTDRHEFPLTMRGGIIAAGAYNAGNDVPDMSGDPCLIWHPKKAAFRIGLFDGVQSINANIGAFSYAGGYNNKASRTLSAILTGEENEATNTGAAIVTGSYNTVSGLSSVIMAGYSNTVSGNYAVIGSGLECNVSGDRSAILAGNSNSITSFDSAIVSGRENSISSYRASVLNGNKNINGGSYSVVGGRYMQLTSTADKSFVWGYATSPVTITEPNVFIIYSGDVGIGTIHPKAQLQVVGNCHVGEDTTNYFEAKSDGEVYLHGTARVGRHLRVGAASLQLGAASPTRGFTGVYPHVSFSHTVNQEAHFGLLVPHRWDSTTDIEICFHWIYTGAQDNGTVKWGLEYNSKNSGEDPTAGSVTITETTAGTHTTGELVYTCISTKILAANLEAGDVFGMRIFRDQANDTLGTGAILLGIHFHFTQNKLGAAT